jgi:hypothetical protein
LYCCTLLFATVAQQDVAIYKGGFATNMQHATFVATMGICCGFLLQSIKSLLNKVFAIVAQHRNILLRNVKSGGIFK